MAFHKFEKQNLKAISSNLAFLSSSKTRFHVRTVTGAMSNRGVDQTNRRDKSGEFRNQKFKLNATESD